MQRERRVALQEIALSSSAKPGGRICSSVLAVRELDRSLAFYATVLGMRKKRRRSPGPKHLTECEVGFADEPRTEITLFHDALLAEKDRGSHTRRTINFNGQTVTVAKFPHVGLLVDDLPDILARLATSSGELVFELRDSSSNVPYFAVVEDPDANSLELYSTHVPASASRMLPQLETGPGTMWSGIGAENLDRAIDFYVTVFGMQVIAQFQPPSPNLRDVVLGFDASDPSRALYVSFDALCTAEQLGTYEPTIIHAGAGILQRIKFPHLRIEVPDVASVLGRVPNEGGSVIHVLPDGCGHVASAFISDADDNTLHVLAMNGEK